MLFIFIIIIIAVIICLIYFGNTTVTVTEHTVESPAIPECFYGYKILQISDFHNGHFGKHQERLISKIKSAAPDMVVITGDFIDSRRTDVRTAAGAIQRIRSIAPICYVTGNHESRVPEAFLQLVNAIEAQDIHILRGESIIIDRGGRSIRISGVDDPAFFSCGNFKSASEHMSEELRLIKTDDMFTVLLTHRPELFDVYHRAGIDLVFAGHAHGGQFRIPFIGGVFAPNQGLFPRYSEGIFKTGNTVMAVSRGLGNSLFPFRVNNPPEIVTITLTGKAV